MRKKKWLIVIVLMAVFTGGLYPDQESDDATDQKEEKKLVDHTKQPFFSALGEDEGEILSAPFRLKGKDLLKWGGIALATGIMIHNDEKIYERIKTYQAEHEWVDKVSPSLSRMCEGYPFGVAGLFWLYGAAFKDQKAAETGSLAMQAMIHSFVVIQLIKHLTGRTRPSEFDGVDRWEGPAGFFKRYEEGKWAQYDAFASGHTITIWSLATVIAHQYNDSPVVPIVCYSLATLGGLATITEDLHWVSDVFIGAVLGYSISRFVVKKRSSKYNVFPIIQPEKLGLSVTYVF